MNTDLAALRTQITDLNRTVRDLGNDVSRTEFSLGTATKRGQAAAIAKHTAALTEATAKLEAAKADRAALEAAYDAAGGQDW